MSKKILVVEDTEDNRQILRDLLGMAGYDMVEAHDGAQGVAMAAEYKPDLILMDIQMPVMDGIDAAKAIREAEKAALQAIEQADRGAAWDEVRRTLFGLTESGASLISWRAEHGEMGHKAENAAFAAALALLADGLINKEQQDTLLRPMSEALPWLLQE